MIRTLMIGLLLVSAVLLQVTVMPVVAVSGYVPDLLLLLVIAFAQQDGVLTGVRVAFPAGLLSDLLSTNVPMGLTAIVYLGIAHAVGRGGAHVSPESLTAPVLFVAGGTFLGVGAHGTLSALLSREAATLQLITEASLIATLYAVLLAPAAIWLVGAVDRTFPRDLSAAAS